MEIVSILIGVVIGLALAAAGISFKMIFAWVEAKIKLAEAQASSHQAVAAVTNARAQILSSAAMAAPTGPTGPTGGK
jgi:hypothetical protein